MTPHARQQAHLSETATHWVWKMRDLIAEWRETRGPCNSDLLLEYAEANWHRKYAERQRAGRFRAYLAGRGIWPELRANSLPVPADAIVEG